MMRILHHYKLALAATAVSLIADGAFAQSQTAFSLGDVAKGPAASSATVSADDSNLRRIGANRGALFFNGESASNEYAFYALPAEIAGTTKLVLSLQTSISTAPESSAMRVFINDQDVGTIKLTAGDPYRAELKVPNGLIQPGYNAVSILVDQKHRVDCTIDATYELWTQIDPDHSGFVFGGKATAGGTAMPDLIALGGINDGRTPNSWPDFAWRLDHRIQPHHGRHPVAGNCRQLRPACCDDRRRTGPRAGHRCGGRHPQRAIIDAGRRSGRGTERRLQCHS
jgi:hypothetical protein